MNRFLLLISVVALLCSTGCQESNSGGNKLVPGDDSSFPKFLVGVWQADSNKFHWGFKFEPDGSISKMVHFFAGQVDLRQGSVYLEGPDPNTYALFVMGPCKAHYQPETRKLSVEVILEFYEMRLPQGVLRGSSKDYLEGPVSADGKTWEVEWRSYGKLEDAAEPDPNLIDAHPEELVFHKLDLAELKTAQ